MSGIFLFFLQSQKRSLALPPSAAGLQARRAGLGRAGLRAAGWQGALLRGAGCGRGRCCKRHCSWICFYWNKCTRKPAAGLLASQFCWGWKIPLQSSEPCKPQWTLGLPGWGAGEVVSRGSCACSHCSDTCVLAGFLTAALCPHALRCWQISQTVLPGCPGLCAQGWQGGMLHEGEVCRWQWLWWYVPFLFT